MSIKKEYVGLAAVIVALVLYLVLRDSDRTHYELPALGTIERDGIDRIEIAGAADSLTLARGDDGWTIEPQGYPVATAKIDEMLGAVTGLTPTSLVSESENYRQYDLTDDAKIRVEAAGGGKVLRRFDVGKAASTYRHTFVLLDGDPRVYQARENVRRVFETTVDQLRDRNVFAVDRDAVTGIAVSDSSGTLDLAKTTKTLEPTEEGAPPVTVTAWLTADSLEADGAVVDQILGRIVNLQADGFPEEMTKAQLGAPAYTLVATGAAGDTLRLYGERDDKKHLASSSRYPFPFLLAEWKVKQIRKSPAELMGESTDE
ncbi:MAG: DUF4340 domain-containing protein [Candidatus Krumholzibacteria bacterium]|nr:DUF4340 domain-containing protein [Candidatus Krumholzibacteria bacterium]